VSTTIKLGEIHRNRTHNNHAVKKKNARSTGVIHAAHYSTSSYEMHAVLVSTQRPRQSDNGHSVCSICPVEGKGRESASLLFAAPPPPASLTATRVSDGLPWRLGHSASGYTRVEKTRLAGLD